MSKASDFFKGTGVEPIGSVRALHVSGSELELDGSYWLKTGAYSTDFVKYPDAKRSIPTTTLYKDNFLDPDGDGFTGNYYAIEVTHIYTIELLNSAVDINIVKYNIDGSFDSAFFVDPALPNGRSIRGCAHDGTHLWILTDQGTRAMFNIDDTTGIYQGTTWLVSGGSANDVCWDGTHFVILSDVDDRAYKYTQAGASPSSFVIVTNSEGITWNGTDYLIGHTSTSITEYDSSGVLTGNTWTLSGVGSMRGMATDLSVPEELFALNSSSKVDVYRQNPPLSVGFGPAKTDTSTGLPMYLKVGEV